MRGTWWFGLLLVAIVAFGGPAAASDPGPWNGVPGVAPLSPADVEPVEEPHEGPVNVTVHVEPTHDDARDALGTAPVPELALSLSSGNDNVSLRASVASSAQSSHETEPSTEHGEADEEPTGDEADPEDCDPADSLLGLVPTPPKLPAPLAPGPLLPDPVVLSPLAPFDFDAPADAVGPSAEPAPSEPARPMAEAVSPVDAPRQLVPPVALAFAGVALAVAAAGGTAVTGNGAALARPLSWLRRALWLPFYARVDKDQVLDHETRQELLDRLRAAPGACIAELQAASGASLNTIRHHLRVLQANGVVTSIKNGRRRCFFPVAVGWSAESRTAAAAVSARAPRRVFRVIEARPGIKQQELAAVLGVTPTSIAFHARRLQDAGIVRAEREGRAMVYYPAGQPVSSTS